MSFKVTLLGAAGGIGQNLCVLCRMDSDISHLSLYDIANVKGVMADISHISSNGIVTCHQGATELDAALEGSDIVIMTSGVAQKPGMSREDLFDINASIVHDLSLAIAKNCPKAMFCIISNPVNSMVPVASSVFKNTKTHDWKRVFGVTTLDVVRNQVFIGQLSKQDPKKIICPVIGGHSADSIIPLYSQCKPSLNLTEKQHIELTEKLMFAGTHVLNEKAGMGSATLSMAYAAHRFAKSVMRGMKGEKGIIECAFVESQKEGVEKVWPIGTVNKLEQANIDKVLPTIELNIKRGLDYMEKRKE